MFREYYFVTRTEDWHLWPYYGGFDGNLKCARCHDKGVGKDLCVQMKDCPVCKIFTGEQLPTTGHPYLQSIKREGTQ